MVPIDKLWPWFLVLPLLFGPGAGEVDVIDMEDYLSRHGWKVRRQWGLADTTATPGKLFRYHFPADAFLGEIDHYEVTEASSDGLPKWLYFNAGAATLEGLPTAQDVGQLYITVIAVGSSSPGGESNSARDAFSVEVLPVSRNSDHCGQAKKVTMVTIILDGKLDSIDATSRVRLMNRTMQYFTLSQGRLRLVPMEDLDESFDGSNFLTGHENAPDKQSGMRLQWPVGCGDPDSTANKLLLATLKASSEAGNLTDLFGLPVLGWSLTTADPFPTRQKRQQPVSENDTETDSVFRWNTEPTIPYTIIGVKQTNDLVATATPAGQVFPTLSPSVSFAATSSAELVSQDFEEIPVSSSSLPTDVVHQADPSSVEHVMSTELFLQPSMALPSTPHTETLLLTDVASYQPTDASTAAVDTVIIPTAATTQQPQDLQPTMRKPDYTLELVAGRMARLTLPLDNLTSIEDRYRRAVRLVLTTGDGTALPGNTWIQVDSETHEIYVLPLSADVRRHRFILSVIHYYTQNVHLEVVVVENPLALSVHSEFMMLVTYDLYRYRFAVDWQTRLVKKLIAFFGDPDDRHILALSADAAPGTFRWANTSLPAHPCPRDAVSQLLDRMAYKGEEVSTLALRRVMAPELRVYKVRVNLVGTCRPKPALDVKAPAKADRSEKPQVRNHIDHITAKQGRMLRLPVPPDTFFDELDGGTSNLTLRLLAINGQVVRESSWIQLSPLQVFRGLPMAADVGSAQYQLVATNSRNLSVADALIITVVEPADAKPPSVEFSLRINADFAVFQSRPDYKLTVLENLTRLFGDPDATRITVRSVTSGSVVFIWTNHTLPRQPCPVARIDRLVQVMFSPDGKVSPQLLQAFKKGYILGAEVIPGGVCLAEVTPTKVDVGPSSTVKTEHAYTDDDVYISTIVPAVVIAAMLIVAALVACVLYRNKRKGKVTADEDHPFVNKGIPIIFAEEMQDMPALARASKEEKPLLPPPRYPQSSGSGASSPPAEPEHESSSEDGSGPDEEAENSPRYQPPPPLASNVDTSVNRSKHTPDYRLPPPYVPP